MTTFKKCVMIDYKQSDLREDDWRRIERLCDQVVQVGKDDPDLTSHLADADCLLLKLGGQADKAMLDGAPNLVYIGILGTGYGYVDATYAAEKKITVCNIAGYSTEGVAELAFGVLLEHLRDISRAKAQARDGNYSEDGFTGTEIKGKTFGIIGLGRIGYRIAKIAMNGFGASVQYWSRERKPAAETEGIRFAEIDELVATSDFLSLNLAYVPETKAFLNRSLLDKLKVGSTVINLSPKELVDLSALNDRLSKGDMTFIFDHSDDLIEDEPQMLSAHSNCIFYPPIGYTTQEATVAKLGMFVDNLENFLNGSPSNKVN